MKMTNLIRFVREYFLNCQCHSLPNISFYCKRFPTPSFFFFKCRNDLFRAFTLDFFRMKNPTIDTIHAKKNQVAITFHGCLDMENVATSFVPDFLDPGECQFMNTSE